VRPDLLNASDANLALAIARYREDALAEAYRRHAGAVFGLARRLLHERAAAEEIVQEVFVRLWNAPDRYDPERGTLRSYLLAQAHGRAVDQLRSESARRRREERGARDTAHGGYDVEREVGDIIVAGQVREILGALPDTERRPIELAYFRGHSYREVATLLGEPEGTVKSRIRSGLKRMHSQLVVAGLGARGEQA
jgi:RNA polymerase sigma-70 factor (ECF subfamily)